jgi:hypothetical protein
MGGWSAMEQDSACLTSDPACDAEFTALPRIAFGFCETPAREITARELGIACAVDSR